jgi:uncharacterized DUF497 family protein
MKFEWDEAKNEQNIRKHGFDFADAESVFAGPLPLLARLDQREDYGEDRWQGIGVFDGIIVVVIVFTEPRTGIVRIISMRKATRNERADYEKRIKN